LLHFLTRLFGSRNERLVRSYGRYVRSAAEFEEPTQRLSDTELRGKTDELMTARAFRDLLVSSRAP